MSETSAPYSAAAAIRSESITARRRVAAILLGIVYGGSFVNGIGLGFSYIRQSANLSETWPTAEGISIGLSIVMMGFLSAYSARSVSIGLATSTVGSATFLLLPEKLLSGALFLVFILMGAGGSYLGRLWAITADDLKSARLFGVVWGHWLWLWIAWRYFVANVVWIGVPISLLYGWQSSTESFLALLFDILKVMVTAIFVGYALPGAVRSIRQDAPLSRSQSVIRFSFWFGAIPLFANLFHFWRD